MLQRLRQVNFVVGDVEQAVGLYESYLGMASVHSYRTTDGRRSVLYAGDGTFVELWHPDIGDAESTSYRESRGQGPYELVFETNDIDSLSAHLSRLGARASSIARREGWRSIVVDPVSANGARLRIVEVEPDRNPWPLAGNGWADAPQPRTQRLRQMAVLVHDLDDAVARWGDMFGLRATKRFQVSFTDLEIAVLPLEGRDTFIELAQPTGPDAPSQRFLDRYGEGIYLTIYEIADSLAVDAHLEERGARFTSSRQTANYTNLGFNSIWLHPAGFLGAFTQLSQVLSPHNPWPPAGDDWYLE
jgi:methylmalonyl-CoA/ethylmalonyl-CoA epimerase